MDIVSDDCLVSILSNLPVDDLNTVALCNRRFRDARSSDSLDQTHTGTFILSEGSTALSLLNAVVENNWKDVFAGNRKRLKLMGVEHLRYKKSSSFSTELLERAQLPGVTVFDASIANNERFMRGLGAFNLFNIFPILKELDMSNLLLGEPMAAVIKRFCGPSIARISWKSNYGFSTQPKCGEYFQGFSLLRDLCIDRFLLWAGPNRHRNRYLFELCHSIERHSIKDCILHDYGIRDGSNTMIELPQEDIIQMVRNHPSLHWLRSDGPVVRECGHASTGTPRNYLCE